MTFFWKLRPFAENCQPCQPCETAPIEPVGGVVLRGVGGLLRGGGCCFRMGWGAGREKAKVNGKGQG